MTRTKQCDKCDGAGGWCRCGEQPDNCDCGDAERDDSKWVECDVCDGSGEVDDDEDDED